MSSNASSYGEALRLASAAGVQAANRSMERGERSEWNEQDWDAAQRMTAQVLRELGYGPLDMAPSPDRDLIQATDAALLRDGFPFEIGGDVTMIPEENAVVVPRACYRAILKIWPHGRGVLAGGTEVEIRSR
ncbi:conserved protein of unknown function [Rhodovastum atsumiense]|uniref:Uncharacterized protein n=1 Tax=Rhodovastum atsumiense TaxID=504468 RepID=A0A5M6IWD3_9PROT|nr:hypothetical protein [Rhodovastum atsumiense]KAA5612137.1 hypothetical protein F1189_10745 [Rhodovastum atsumiense]CAH2603920.1 conserved protein of unknown function [Rhodovastum atsumiense]